MPATGALEKMREEVRGLAIATAITITDNYFLRAGGGRILPRGKMDYFDYFSLVFSCLLRISC